MKKYKKYREEDDDDDYTLAKKAEEKAEAEQDELDKIILQTTTATPEIQPEIKKEEKKGTEVSLIAMVLFCIAIFILAAVILLK